MRSRFALLAPAFAAVVGGCSSSPSSPSPDAGAPLPPGVTTVTYTMQSHVAAGAESHTCLFVTAPANGDTFVVGGSHVYTLGSHHMILFKTDLTAMPAGGDQPHDCYEAPGGSDMGHIRGVIYAAQTPTASVTYPASVGLPLKSGEILLMQTHYLDAGDKPLDARADVTLQVSDGTGITTRAGVLFFYDPFIDVAPGSTSARAQLRCLIPNDITLLSASSHYHARGNGYGAFIDAPDGTLAQTPFYTSTDWDHPTPLLTKMPIAAGSRVRFSCTYANPDPQKEYFQGQSAANDEMCMFVGVYYPEMGQSADFCQTSPDMYSTGSANCGTSLNCLQACVKAGKPIPNPGVGNLDVDPCYQKCLVNECATAGAKETALDDCTKKNCATQCADSSSSACQSCAFSSCSTELNACLSDACK